MGYSLLTPLVFLQKVIVAVQTIKIDNPFLILIDRPEVENTAGWSGGRKNVPMSSAPGFHIKKIPPFCCWSCLPYSSLNFFGLLSVLNFYVDNYQ